MNRTVPLLVLPSALICGASFGAGIVRALDTGVDSFAAGMEVCAALSSLAIVLFVLGHKRRLRETKSGNTPK